jgi:hypothetical protein
MKALPAPKKRIEGDVGLAIVNIVFLLIFFFLTSGQLISGAAGDVDLARTTELPLDRLPQPILVVNAAGWELDGVPVLPERLGIAMRDIDPALPLHILINRDSPAAALLAVVGRPELATRELRLVTLRDSQAGAS